MRQQLETPAMSCEAIFDPGHLVSCPALETKQSYSTRDTILYALGVGAGATDLPELQYIYEKDLNALPTMATVLAHPGAWLRDPLYRINWRMVVHGEQSSIFHRALPLEGDVMTRQSVISVHDKGAGKGALIYTRRELFDAVDGELLATLIQGNLLRGDGGHGSAGDNTARFPHAVPVDREPDIVLTLPTRVEQAALYRLLGDFNPLHIDPVAARTAGYPGPILHGLCSYGMAARAVIATFCDDRPGSLRRLDLRFTGPVFPGESIRFDIWVEGPGRLALRAVAHERDQVVLNNGYAEHD
ncbi:MaoC/PaaZ C-terminal domain-containing protein [Sphingobium sp. V4]|uniref:MaoC family dehydratase n=1 Tax=Sphingobium sp. V4 TaxID=3038927 RepID=UPI0025583891|nr:MaoC family dehydratase [Sphingobium sp. V4]WIW89454.1 MaoC/PaaZ C-terminal domain-containing protein [Sphingobium sp. V4]